MLNYLVRKSKTDKSKNQTKLISCKKWFVKIAYLSKTTRNFSCRKGSRLVVNKNLDEDLLFNR